MFETLHTAADTPDFAPLDGLKKARVLHTTFNEIASVMNLSTPTIAWHDLTDDEKLCYLDPNVGQLLTVVLGIEESTPTPPVVGSDKA